MMQEIVDDWKDWKYDIIELNNSTWTQRDEHKLNAITAILEDNQNCRKKQTEHDRETNNKTNVK